MSNNDEEKDSRVTWFMLGAIIALLWFSLNARIGKLENAIQERKATSLDVGKQTAYGQAMGEARTAKVNGENATAVSD